MPLPSQIVIMLAKTYAHRIEVGKTAAQAYDYISTQFGATRRQVQSAVRQAQKAMRVGEVLATLRPKDKIRAALEGQRAPAKTVGVRVEVTRIDVEGRGAKEDRVNTLYVEVPWDATVHDVLAKVHEWFDATQRGSGRSKAWEVQFRGPSLWPGQSVTQFGGL